MCLCLVVSLIRKQIDPIKRVLIFSPCPRFVLFTSLKMSSPSLALSLSEIRRQSLHIDTSDGDGRVSDAICFLASSSSLPSPLFPFSSSFLSRSPSSLPSSSSSSLIEYTLSYEKMWAKASQWAEILESLLPASDLLPCQSKLFLLRYLSFQNISFSLRKLFFGKLI